MRWLTWGAAGAERPGVLISPEEVLDVAGQWPHLPRSWRALLSERLDLEVARLVARGDYGPRHVRPLRGLTLAPPIPDPSKIIALGRNYPSHAAEQRRRSTAEPLLFAKAPSSLIGHEAVVVVPPHEAQPDYEAEMVLIIGRPARDVRPEAALERLAGVTAFNDVSGRAAQFGDKLWFRGKSFDTFAPCGPWAVTLDESGDPGDLALRLKLNGEERQAGRTSEMTVPPAEIVAYVSRQMTLQPGDLIATGTPAGVGVFRDPPTFLQEGDRIEVELERVGVLANTVRRRGAE